MTTVLTDNELLSYYDTLDSPKAMTWHEWHTGIGLGMGVETERRAYWDAVAAHRAAARALTVAILRRHEGLLVRALEAREARAAVCALVQVLALVAESEADAVRRPYAGLAAWLPRQAPRGALRWVPAAQAAGWDLWDDSTRTIATVRVRAGEVEWAHRVGATGLSSGTSPTAKEAIDTIAAALRAEGWAGPG
jgi:hypothetical protein